MLPPQKHPRRYLSPSKNPSQKLIFDPALLDMESKQFEFTSSRELNTPSLSKANNPKLLAFRRKSSRDKSPKVHIFQPNRIQKSMLQPKRINTELLNREIPALVTARQTTELDKKSINFNEDELTYFSKRKDGRGHRFLYMIYDVDPDNPSFSPYRLKKVPFAEKTKEYFVMSATGMMKVFSDGTTETIPLERWAIEQSNYEYVKKSRFFALYRFWKNFGIWKRVINTSRYSDILQTISDHPLMANSSFFLHTN